MSRSRRTYFLWRPRSLNWWIALLFMIGAALFAAGSVLVLAGSAYTYAIDLIYFIGSIFFTAAGYSQYNQSINVPVLGKASAARDDDGRSTSNPARLYFAIRPRRTDFWATFPQFLGTLAFNVSTLMAFADVPWLGYDILVWAPDYVGSVLFLVSGTAAVIGVCHRVWCWNRKSLTWWSVVINFVGCIAFMISAFAAFVRPNPIFNNLATWATLFTLLGAICFLAGAYLMWPQMIRDESAMGDHDPSGASGGGTGL